jgi:hypothetical protein
MWRLRTICWTCAFLVMLHISIPAQSQSPDTNTQTPGSAPTKPSNTAPRPVPDQPALKPAELDALVAPIALSRELGKATFPVIEPAPGRYVRQKSN